MLVLQGDITAAVFIKLVCIFYYSAVVELLRDSSATAGQQLDDKVAQQSPYEN